VFINATSSIILTYVNDLVIITRTKAKIAALKAQLFSKFKCHNLRLIAYYLGIRVCRDRNKRTIELSIELYINKLSYDFNCNKAPRCYYLLNLKALKLRLRAKDNVALAQLTQRY
jgi:hypothetical protein